MPKFSRYSLFARLTHIFSTSTLTWPVIIVGCAWFLEALSMRSVQANGLLTTKSSTLSIGGDSGSKTHSRAHELLLLHSGPISTVRRRHLIIHAIVCSNKRSYWDCGQLGQLDRLFSVSASWSSRVSLSLHCITLCVQLYSLSQTAIVGSRNLVLSWLLMLWCRVWVLVCTVVAHLVPGDCIHVKMADVHWLPTLRLMITIKILAHGEWW